MTPDQIVRAWKDADFSAALGDASALPPNPVGAIELPDNEIGLAAGGYVEWHAVPRDPRLLQGNHAGGKM